MAGQRLLLWPYDSRVALLAVPLIWLGCTLILVVTHHYVGWPDVAATKALAPLVALTGFVPLLLCLVDYIAGSRAVLDVKGIKIDFSQAEIKRASIELPENIGMPGAIISDSSPMQIIAALEAVTGNQIVRLDIKSGDAWWVTRLLALSAGATRAGSPTGFVFVGIKENREGVFLGWAPPVELLGALLNDNNSRGPQNVTYGFVYRKAEWIARQLTTFVNPGEPRPSVVPADPPNLPALPAEVQRYANQPMYAQLGDAALEQVLMDQMAAYHLEDTPDRLTLGRLEELFAHCLYRDAVELSSPKEGQVSAFLGTDAPYVAVVRNGKYEGLVERTEVERMTVRQLFTQMQPAKG
jgi:hypothetical protein